MREKGGLNWGKGKGGANVKAVDYRIFDHQDRVQCLLPPAGKLPGSVLGESFVGELVLESLALYNIS